jgi:hypothetical protein
VFSLQIYIKLEETSEAAQNTGVVNVKVLTVIL